MTDIFQEGDVVYHPYLGKGVVRDAYTVDFANDEAWHHDTEYGTALLSFSPWPEPNHVRPLKDGVYKVTIDDWVTVLACVGGLWYYVNAQHSNIVGDKISHQYAVDKREFLFNLP